jgi:hypothetical protein
MICTTIDDYIMWYHETFASWVVTLNNGITVFQDDDRPGEYPASAWQRLRNYCELNQLHITDMEIKFRSNKHRIDGGMDGYFFSKGVRGTPFMPKTIQLFFVGTIHNSILNVSCWRVPEMLKDYTESRNIKDSLECLIINPSLNTNLFLGVGN